ncbi:MutL-like protein [Coniella lustricola]|uniref:MutL-like protein n=1 Tax=Coniella lustricola TaxID=2025994 RepID=A0A2T3AKW0_9PEZI|nr:MutL-like protein [Coniella lustricola]
MAETSDVDVPRGTKRKADELGGQSSDAPRRIRALDADVVNKIAAGEIIVAPVHALKELIENAVDAGSTSLEVLAKEGGLKLLQITDNGSGIDKEDLPILCERFTTSKLQKFEDLSSIATYGFRGEALASISHIAHLTVTTKTKNSTCAWRALYNAGKLVPSKPGQTPDPRPVAGRNGTQITVEDLFYNIPTRRRAFRSPSDEYNKIIDMVGRYAVHCSHVAFSCKKQGESSTSISVPATAAVVDRIRQIYGTSVANELVEYSTSDDRWGFKATGHATNANYHIKKTTLLLFINHRCVESTNIKKALEQTYAAFLPKNGHPFVYLSLEIDPQRIDVNVHPTKREVNFLNEDDIIQAICEHLRSTLAAVDQSRTFMTQTLLPGPDWATPAQDANGDNAATPDTTKSTSRRTTRHENTLIRTDTNLRKITSMFAPAEGSSQVINNGQPPAMTASDTQPLETLSYEIVDRERKPCGLASVRELRSGVRDKMHHELTEVFATHAFVGIVDERRRLAAIQGGLKLYLVDYGRVCFEYLYQVALTDFGNFGIIQFSPALDLRAVLRVAAEHEKQTLASAGGEEDDMDVDKVVEMISNQLIERREMLLEYFALEISPAGELSSIPLLVKGYTPSMAKMPQFLLRLGPYVNWEDEKPCFETFLKELASFYVPEILPPTPGNAEDAAAEKIDEHLGERRKHVRWAVEHVFFPAFKARLVATQSLMKVAVLEVANLKGLYRVFERC